MKVNFPGLLIERHRNGSLRYRVRVARRAERRIHIPVPPDHPLFGEYYAAARAGVVYSPEIPVKLVVRSLDWLAQGYLAHLENLVTAKLASPLTLKQRRSQLRRICDFDDGDGRYGDFDIDAPTAAFVRLRDAFIATPAEADNMMKTARAMYAWAVERGEISQNPVKGISKVHRSQGGAEAWTTEDLRRFRAAHPLGTMAHLWLTLHMFTACRISDAIWLGPEHEVERDGMLWLDWQPAKKGSVKVTIPILGPLLRATRATSVQGPTYLLTEAGKPFTTPEGLRNRVRKWCQTAGLTDRSAHGIRKAVAELLAEAGCSQHQIMAIMAHSQAKTSEIYTRGAQRHVLSEDAMQALASLEW